MREAWTWLRGRLSRRPDSEHAQGLLRIGLILVVLAYVLLPSTRQAADPLQYAGTLRIVLAGLAVGLGLFAALLFHPGRSDARRLLGMVADYGLMAAAMIRLDEPLAWVYALVLAVTVGNGLRYGTRYLALAVAMALAGFGSVLWLSDYWTQNRALGVGLLVGLAAVPLYLAVLLRQLTRATDEARRASEAKSLFLANMSHELRTPLNSLVGMSELLADTRLDAEQREYVTTLRASSRTLMALVEDVLDISAIEAGKVRLHVDDFSPRDVVAGVGLVMQGQARARNLDYLVVVADEVPETVRGDAGHLRQVLLNLVGNAVKFTEQGRVRVDVSVLAGDEAHARLRFAVTDTGIGVPARMAGRLFDPFEQDEVGMQRRYGGTGLGTSIAKGLTEAMGGRIGYDSVEGRGSCFWIEVPFAKAEPVVAQPAPMPVAGAEEEAPPRDSGDNVIAFGDPLLRHRVRVRGMRLLVADDHEDNRAVLQRLLQKAGHRASCVEGAEQALQALATGDYDAVVADLHMPGTSGLDLLRKVRAMQGGARVRPPVVILSADATPEARRRCERAGAFAFLVKPVAVGRLLETLSEVAALRERQGTGTVAPPASAGAWRVADGVLDASVLDELAAMGMGAEFEREFIAHCLADADGCIGAMSHAAESADWARLRDHAHAIKGVAANLGLVRVAELGSGLMRLADWQVRNEWRQRIAMLNAALTQGREALDARLASRGIRDGGGEPG